MLSKLRIMVRDRSMSKNSGLPTRKRSPDIILRTFTANFGAGFSFGFLALATLTYILTVKAIDDKLESYQLLHPMKFWNFCEDVNL